MTKTQQLQAVEDYGKTHSVEQVDSFIDGMNAVLAAKTRTANDIEQDIVQVKFRRRTANMNDDFITVDRLSDQLQWLEEELLTVGKQKL